jgi:hypothetical protein
MAMAGNWTASHASRLAMDIGDRGIDPRNKSVAKTPHASLDKDLFALYARFGIT